MIVTNSVSIGISLSFVNVMFISILAFSLLISSTVGHAQSHDFHKSSFLNQNGTTNSSLTNHGTGTAASGWIPGTISRSHVSNSTAAPSFPAGNSTTILRATATPPFPAGNSTTVLRATATASSLHSQNSTQSSNTHSASSATRSGSSLPKGSTTQVSSTLSGRSSTVSGNSSLRSSPILQIP